MLTLSCFRSRDNTKRLVKREPIFIKSVKHRRCLSMKWFRVVVFIATCLLTLPQILALANPTVIPITDNKAVVNNETSEGNRITVSPQEDEDFPAKSERVLKGFIKEGVKMVLSRIMSSWDQGPNVSPKCVKAFMRFISDLRKTRMWALKMLDASSKIPAGVFEGTFTDYGDFDECLEISVPLRNGSEDFRGRYCSIEAAPRLPPIPKNFSLYTLQRAGPFDTIAAELRLSTVSFHFLQFRFGVCVPSSCSTEDIKSIVPSVVDMSRTVARVPKCYVKEDLKLHAVHIAVICVSAALVILSISGAVVDYFKGESMSMNSGPLGVLSSFSLTRNIRKLFAASKGDLEALHGIRFLSMAWVILGHTYVNVGFNRVRRLSNMRNWIDSFEFEAVLNGWLSVEPFFFLSGFLTCYGTLRVLEKTKGRLNFPMFVIHRYLRLTPPMLMFMGLLLFLPLIASGPIWYEAVDDSVEPCWNYWWTNILYISNWWPISKICGTTVWYLSADFQMFILSPLVLLLLYRSALFGMVALILLTLLCTVAVGVLTYIFELPPAILISTGNTEQITKELNMIHIKTFTHVGPYCIGVATGYLILTKKKSLKFKKWQNVIGWSASIILSVCSVYGAHRWNTGNFHGPFVTSLYAAMHRSTFILGVAWVAVACITGHGGPVNRILSSRVWTALGRLTYVIYLLHTPIILIRSGSIRERFYLNHYNMMYEYFSNLVFVVSMSLPFYLLVEAPSNNLQQMMFGRLRSTKGNGENKNAENTSARGKSNMDLPSRTSADTTSIEIAFPSGKIQNGISGVVTDELVLNNRKTNGASSYPL